MVLSVQYFGERRPKKVRPIIPDSDLVSPVFWHGDLGGDPADWSSPGELLSQGRNNAGWDSTLEMDIWELVLSLTIMCP